MKLFYLVIPFSFTCTVFAQSAQTFPDSNAVWVNGYYSWDQYHINYDHFLTTYCMGKEDTTIGSYTYSKINYCGGAYKGATRTESGKVYYIPKDSTEDYLLYDFSAQEGDLLYNVYAESISAGPYPDPIRVDGVDQILINNIPHKIIHVGGVDWIEGIGNSTNGLFAGIETLESFYYTQMDCMSQNDTTLYPNFSLQSCNLTLGNTEASQSKDLTISPNPVQHTVSIEWNDSWKDVSLQLFNASGQAIHPVFLYSSNHRMEVDLSAYPEGLYSVVVTTLQKNHTTKILKQ